MLRIYIWLYCIFKIDYLKKVLYYKITKNIDFSTFHKIYNYTIIVVVFYVVINRKYIIFRYIHTM